MTRLQLRLLGEFSVQSEQGWTLPLPNRKDQALLAYLAMQSGNPVPRTTLASLLWGECDDAAARHSLSQALTTLRKSLPAEDQLMAGRQSVSLNRAAFSVDALEFLQLANDSTVKSLDGALSLYRGEFLEGLIVGEEPFEDWLQQQRHRFRRAVQGTYAQLLEHYERSGQRQRAVDCCLMLLAQDPYNEGVLRKLMITCVQSGKGGDALQAYQRFAHRLQRDLKIEPDAATKEVYLRIVQSRQSRKASGGPDSQSVNNGLIDAFRSLDGFALWDEQDRFVLANDNYREILKPAAELLKPGVTWEEIVRHCATAGRFPEAIGQVEEWMAARRKTRKSGVTDTRDLLLDDGRLFRLAHWKTETGGTAIVLTDITSRKQEQIDVFVARGRFDALVVAVSRPVLELDPKGIVVFANELMHRSLSQEPGQLVGRHCEDFIASPRPFLRHAISLGHMRTPRRVNVRMTDKTGAAFETAVDLTSYPNEDGRLAGYILIVKPS